MSATITVRFTGICTHILSGLGTRAQHRIVLVRADHGANILGHAIPPHIPTLYIEPGDIEGVKGTLDGLKPLGPGMWQLAGARLELEGLATERYAPHKSYNEEVPHLESRGGKLDNVGHEVVVQERAAGYFDIYGGRFKATKTKHRAVSTTLTAKVSGKPRLKVTCFWNRETSSIALRPGATIHVQHTGTMRGDTAYDFLLHYLIFPSIPDDVEIPREKKLSLPKNPNDISAGCSNSQYP